MASFLKQTATKSRATTLSVLLYHGLNPTSYLCHRSLSLTRTLRLSNSFYDDDFYGLKKGIGKSYKSDNEQNYLKNGYSESLKYDDILKDADPKSFEFQQPDRSEDSVQVRPYGFVRFDNANKTATSKEEKRKKKKQTKSQEKTEVLMEQSYLQPVLHDQTEEDQNIDNNEVNKTLQEDVFRGRSGENTASSEPVETIDQNLTPLNYIDEQYFQQESFQQASCTSNKCHEVDAASSSMSLIDETDASFIDHQYFAHGYSGPEEIKPENSVTQSLSLIDEISDLSGSFENYINQTHDKNIQTSIISESETDMSYVDEQYFGSVTHRESKSQKFTPATKTGPESMSQKFTPAAKPGSESKSQHFTPAEKTGPRKHELHVAKQSFDNFGDEKSDFTDRMFREAKDFRQHQKTLHHYHENQRTLYEGKAHSVVKEIREENKFQSNFEISKVSLDGKGFRVLKNQVPNLEKASRIDIIRLLRKSIIYNENGIVAIDKPYGLHLQKGTGVKIGITDLLDDIIPSTRLYLTHRLDKEVTGVTLLAKSEDTANHLHQLFVKQEIKKRYLAITKGYPSSPKGLIDIPIAEEKINDKYRMALRPYKSRTLKSVMKKKQEGLTAKTLYRVLDSKHMCSLIECIAITGIRHQIRVHLSMGLNCPVLGDHKYAHISKIAPMHLHPETLEKLKVQQSKVRYVPMHLHARSVMIPDFLNGKHLFISAPLPYHFVTNVRSLKLKLPPQC